MVACGGQRIFERYGSDAGPGRWRDISALEKSARAALVLRIDLSDERLSLDEPISRYVRQWRDDPLERAITLRQPISHSSGLDDVGFLRKQSARKQALFEQPDPSSGFGWAVTTAPVGRLLGDSGARWTRRSSGR